MSIPILDLSWASDPQKKPDLLKQLHAALFDIGFLYISNHGVPQETIDGLTDRLPALFDLPAAEKIALAKINSPHFVGYNGYAEETTLGQQDLREQFDYATELPVVYSGPKGTTTNDQLHGGTKDDRDFSKLYWLLRGPNQWPSESSLPGFRQSFTNYHDAVAELSYRFVHLIEEAFDIPVGTFDHFFGRADDSLPASNNVHQTKSAGRTSNSKVSGKRIFLPPQHRIKLLRYPPTPASVLDCAFAQGVGAHKDSSGWLTFLYQPSSEPGLEVLSPQDNGTWLPAPPIRGTFVVNFGNALEAATEGAIRATTHRVVAPRQENQGGKVRYSVPFFMGLPLDMTVSEVQSYIPEEVRSLRKKRQESGGQVNDEFDAFVSSYLDPRWDELGESNLRKWIRSHRDVGDKWYGKDAVEYYTR